jgi:hypothetical protein
MRHYKNFGILKKKKSKKEKHDLITVKPAPSSSCRFLRKKKNDLLGASTLLDKVVDCSSM